MLDAPPRNVAELRQRMIALGLSGRYSCQLTDNRTVVVSFRNSTLRVHRAYLAAPDSVLRAIVVFVQGRGKAERAAARQQLLMFKPAIATDASAKPRRSRERTHADDEPMMRKLIDRHTAFNAERFAGELRSIPIRVSRRMKSRLGHYSWARPDGSGAEIVISSRHIRRHGMDEAGDTLLHEMVHQWQNERGLAVDHGRAFRAKARAIGIPGRACREVRKEAGLNG